MFGVAFHEVEESALASALRGKDFDSVLSAFGERLFQQSAVFKINGNVNGLRQIFGFKVKLLQKRRNKFVRIELLEVLPVEFAPVDHAAATQVKKIGGNERRLGVIGEHVGIVTLCRGDALTLLDIFQGAQQIAVGGGLLEELLLGRGAHALF